MPNVLCGCGQFMQVSQNGVTVEELDDDGMPYTLWDADAWRCAGCGSLVITGQVGAIPATEPPTVGDCRAGRNYRKGGEAFVRHVLTLTPEHRVAYLEDFDESELESV
jgi:hypothetical protein